MLGKELFHVTISNQLLDETLQCLTIISVVTIFLMVATVLAASRHLDGVLRGVEVFKSCGFGFSDRSERLRQAVEAKVSK